MKTKLISFLLLIIVLINCANGSSNIPSLVQSQYFENNTIEWFPDIVGGTPVPLAEMNGVVSIQNINGHHLCSGILISFKSVVTAANCLFNQSSQLLRTSEIRVIADETELFGNGSETRQTQQIEDIVLSSMDGIAILELINAFDETATLKYIAISNSMPAEGDKCQVIGWGSRSSYSEIQLQTVDLTILSFLILPSNDRTLTDDSVAAISEHEACFGDLGSALLCDNKISGILTFGYGCTGPNFPLIFNKVSNNILITARKGRKPGSGKPSGSKPGGYYPSTGGYRPGSAAVIKLSIGVICFSMFQFGFVKFINNF